MQRIRKTSLVGFVWISLISILMISCSDDKRTPDVSKIKVQLESRRLDRDLFALDTNRLADGLNGLQARYPDFLNFYLDTLMGFNIRGDFSDTAAGVQQGLRVFLSHKDYRGLFDTVAAHFPDTRDIEQELTKGFRYMKYYFPDYRVPKLVYFTSGLNSYSAISYDDIVGVGLDMYLGPHYPFYASVGIAAYLSQRLKPEYIPVDVFKVIYRDDHPFTMDDRNLLDMMIQRGKEQYFLEQVLPFTDDTLRLGYTARQLQWCRENEAQVYNFFVKDNLLYETRLQEVGRYVNDGPGTAKMPPESPGNIGAFVGLQIVRSYMKEHPDVTLPQLLRDQDAQRFLEGSKYKPR